MMKTRLIWVMVVLVALVTVIVSLVVTGQDGLTMAETRVEQLPEGQSILCSAYPEFNSVQKGDAFLYTLEVVYDKEQVDEVDRESLNDNVNLSPFEIREITETEFDLDSETRVYQRSYEIQLISGSVAHLYEFPTIVVRYKLGYADGYAETPVIPETVYVAPRLISDVSDIIDDLEIGQQAPLRPLKNEVEGTDKSYLPWIFWSVGGLVIVMASADLTLQFINRRKEGEKTEEEIDMSSILCQAYRSLKDNMASGAKPGSLLHQMDHILRLILIQKENASWLEDTNLDMVSDEIKPSVTSLSEKCQKAYAIKEIKQQQVEEALKQLEAILEFYFEEEMEEWES